MSRAVATALMPLAALKLKGTPTIYNNVVVATALMPLAALKQLTLKPMPNVFSGCNCPNAACGIETYNLFELVELIRELQQS